MKFVSLTTALLLLPQQTARTTAAVEPAAALVRPAVPFGIGEKIDYQVKFGIVSVGRGSIEVLKLDTLRGRPVWNVQLHISGGIPLGYRLNSTNMSWIDTATFASLRYHHDQTERGRFRARHYEIFPERATYRLKLTPDTMPELPSVMSPLDEASFLYFVRTVPLRVGETYVWDRYFRPDRNPVTIRVLRKENVSVPAGNFPAIVIQPTIKTTGIFSEGGEALLWISDDPSRMILKLESKVSAIGSLHLNMTGYTPPRRQ